MQRRSSRGNPNHDWRGRFCSASDKMKQRASQLDEKLKSVSGKEAESLKAEREDIEKTLKKGVVVSEKTKEEYEARSAERARIPVIDTESGKQVGTATVGDGEIKVEPTNGGRSVPELMDKSKKSMQKFAVSHGEIMADYDYADYGFSSPDHALDEFTTVSEEYYCDFHDNACEKLKESSAEDLQEYAKNPDVFLEDVGDDMGEYCIRGYDDYGDSEWFDVSHHLAEDATTCFIENEDFVDDMYKQKVLEENDGERLLMLAQGERDIDRGYLSDYATQKARLLGLMVTE